MKRFLNWVKEFVIGICIYVKDFFKYMFTSLTDSPFGFLFYFHMIMIFVSFFIMDSQGKTVMHLFMMVIFGLCYAIKMLEQILKFTKLLSEYVLLTGSISAMFSGCKITRVETIKEGSDEQKTTDTN